MKLRGFLLTAPIALAAFGLTSCASGTGLADLDRAATDEDQWPTDLPDYAAENLDPGTSRLVGFDGATAVYLAESTAPASRVCLLIYPNDGEDWVVGCGSNGLSVGGGGHVTYTVRGDGLGEKDDEAISQNVYVRR